VLKTRSFSGPKATPTIPSAVPNAVKHGNQNVTVLVAAAATELRARCFPLPALNVAKAPKFRFNLVVISPFTAAIATAKSDPADK